MSVWNEAHGKHFILLMYHDNRGVVFTVCVFLHSLSFLADSLFSTFTVGAHFVKYRISNNLMKLEALVKSYPHLKIANDHKDHQIERLSIELLKFQLNHKT